MVPELAEFLLTTLKTHINCKSYNRFDENNQKRFEIFCRDFDWLLFIALRFLSETPM